MRRRIEIGALVVLLGVLALVVLRSTSQSPEFALVLASDEKFERLKVENPSLKLDLLERIRKLEYSGMHRNIFTATKPEPPKPPEPDKPVDTTPQPEPALQVPFKFYGYATDPATGKRRGFFTNGDDVWIIPEGGIIQNRFRVLRIGNTTVEVEEISSGRRATLQLEEQAAPSG